MSSPGEQHSLLLELGCEELPANSLAALAAGFASGVADALRQANLIAATEACKIFSTPRRLAVLINNVAGRQQDQSVSRRGPAVSAAFDAAGNPTKAAQGFARSLGVNVDELERLQTEQGEWLVYQQQQPGKTLAEILQQALPGILKALPMPKTMHWGAHALRFLRPLHWLLALHGDQILPVALAHLQADRISYGHRVHAPGALPVATANSYLDALHSACVEADPEQRKNAISQQIAAICSEHDLIADKIEKDYSALLDEVCNLVEWPVAVLCEFDEVYLQLPEEVLSLSMRSQQKFFPLNLAADGSLSHRFIAVANLQSADNAQVRAGYERVISPRLADARFFWDQDRRQPLAAYIPALDNISFQQQLGSVGDKARRMRALANWLATQLAADPHICNRAAELALCDLSTGMVGEFPELQGIIGRHYALASGEAPDVAHSIEQHYRPRSASDAIAATLPAQVLAIAEKCDRLLTIFAVGKKPDGSKDPYALRRAALGLLRTILEAELQLDMGGLLRQAAAGLNAQDSASVTVTAELIDELKQFVLDRLQAWLHDQHGISVLTFRAVAAISNNDLLDMQRRMLALQQFAEHQPDAAASLAAANKRVVNLLAKSARDELDVTTKIDPSLLARIEEKALFEHCQTLRNQLTEAIADADYQQALLLLAGLQQPIDAFFDQVMVMCEDAALRHNRLSLLSTLRQLCNQFADIALLEQG